MNYSYEQLEQDIAAIDKRLKPIRKDRGKRYGSPEDTLRNVRRAGGKHPWHGAYVHAVECMCRLERMKDDGVKDWADFENASDDLINYAYYISVLAGVEKPSWRSGGYKPGDMIMLEDGRYYILSSDGELEMVVPCK